MKRVVKAPYSVSVKSSEELRADVISNFGFMVLISGQIVTVGNGISIIEALALDLIFTGLSCHSSQILRTIEPHNKSDTQNEIIHHHLKENLHLKKKN